MRERERERENNVNACELFCGGSNATFCMKNLLINNIYIYISI